MPKLRTAGPVRIGDLSPATVDVVLEGTSAADPFMEFLISASQVEAAWRLYGPALLAEARRRGLPDRPAYEPTTWAHNKGTEGK